MYDVVMENHNEETEQGIYAPNLERLMQIHGVNASDLARMTGINKSTISLILRGKRHATNATNLIKMANVFGVSVDYLLNLTDQPAARPTQLGDLLLELTQVARKLSSRRQRDLIAIAQAYLACPPHHPLLPQAASCLECTTMTLPCPDRQGFFYFDSCFHSSK
jgi:transcriptional regulator with XRE-family HTH domain